MQIKSKKIDFSIFQFFIFHFWFEKRKYGENLKKKTVRITRFGGYTVYGSKHRRISIRFTLQEAGPFSFSYTYTVLLLETTSSSIN